MPLLISSRWQFSTRSSLHADALAEVPALRLTPRQESRAGILAFGVARQHHAAADEESAAERQSENRAILDGRRPGCSWLPFSAVRDVRAARLTCVMNSRELSRTGREGGHGKHPGNADLQRHQAARPARHPASP